MTTSRPVPGTDTGTVEPPAPRPAGGAARGRTRRLAIGFLDKSLPGLAADQLMADLGMSRSQFGLVGSADYLLSAVTCLVAGVVADRWSTARLLPVLALVWSVSQLPILLFSSAGVLLLGRLLLGAAAGPSVPIAHAAAYTWFPEQRRGLPAGVLTCGASIAKLALAPALGLVIVWWGWRSAVVVVAVLGLAWAIGWWLAGGEGPYARHRRTRAERASSPDRTPLPPLRGVLLTRTFLGSAGLLVSQSVLAGFVLTWLPSYFREALGFSALQASVLFGLPSAFGLVVLLSTGALSDRLRLRGVSSRAGRGVLGGVISIAAGLLLTVLPSVDDAILAIVLLVGGYGLSVAVQVFCNPVVAEIAPPGRRTGLLALLAAVSSVGAFAGPVMTGALLDAAPDPVSGYATALRVFGGLLIVGGIGFALLVHPVRDGATG